MVRENLRHGFPLHARPEGGLQMVERLQLEDPTDAIVLTTVTAKGDISGATTNLKAPLVINNKKQMGMQIVLNNKDYQIKQALFQSGDSAARQV